MAGSGRVFPARSAQTCGEHARTLLEASSDLVATMQSILSFLRVRSGKDALELMKDALLGADFLSSLRGVCATVESASADAHAQSGSAEHTAEAGGTKCSALALSPDVVETIHFVAKPGGLTKAFLGALPQTVQESIAVGFADAACNGGRRGGTSREFSGLHVASLPTEPNVGQARSGTQDCSPDERRAFQAQIQSLREDRRALRKRVCDLTDKVHALETSVEGMRSKHNVEVAMLKRAVNDAWNQAGGGVKLAQLEDPVPTRPIPEPSQTGNTRVIKPRKLSKNRAGKADVADGELSHPAVPTSPESPNCKATPSPATSHLSDKMQAVQANSHSPELHPSEGLRETGSSFTSKDSLLSSRLQFSELMSAAILRAQRANAEQICTPAVRPGKPYLASDAQAGRLPDLRVNSKAWGPCPAASQGSDSSQGDAAYISTAPASRHNTVQDTGDSQLDTAVANAYYHARPHVLLQAPVKQSVAYGAFVAGRGETGLCEGREDVGQDGQRVSHLVAPSRLTPADHAKTTAFARAQEVREQDNADDVSASSARRTLKRQLSRPIVPLPLPTRQGEEQAVPQLAVGDVAGCSWKKRMLATDCRPVASRPGKGWVMQCMRRSDGSGIDNVREEVDGSDSVAPLEVSTPQELMDVEQLRRLLLAQLHAQHANDGSDGRISAVDPHSYSLQTSMASRTLPVPFNLQWSYGAGLPNLGLQVSADGHAVQIVPVPINSPAMYGGAVKG